jgi:VWFA-related protein
LGIGLVSLTLAAQQKSAPPKSAPPPTVDAGVIRLDVTNVNLLFTVSDKKGRFVSDLTREDFEILENKKPQVISQFTAETNLPLRLAILMDTSSSIRDRFRFIQTAASDFVNTTVRQGQDKATIFSFDSNAELVADMTDDTADLGVKIRGMRPGGGTAMYDAIYAACRDKLMPEQPREKFRRAVIILSDGEDNQSRWTREQALEMAHRADAVIYTISTNITHTDTSGDRILKHFAEETGGIAFFPFKAEDLSQSFENIGNELRHQYNVFYVPNPLRADGLYHTVDIKVKEHKDAVVRARHGYYAPLYK